MPTYRVTAPDGRKVSLTGETPPTKEQLDKIFAQLGESAPPSRTGVAGAAALSKAGLSEAPWYARPVIGPKLVLGVVEKLPGVPPLGPEVRRAAADHIPTMGPSFLQSLEVLPAAGGTIGGLIGSGGFLAGPTGIPSTAGGAALGGGFGRSLRDLLRRAVGASAPETSGEAALEIGKSAAKEGVAELLGLQLLRGARAISAPGAAGLDAGVQSAARRQGVEMPASALTTSRPVAYAETVASEGIGGSLVSKRIAQAQARLAEIADEAVSAASRGQSSVQQGEAIARGLERFKRQWIHTKNNLYTEIEQELPGLTVKADETVRLLEDIVSKKQGAARILEGGPTKDKSLFDGLLEGLTEVKGPVSRDVALAQRVREAQEGLQNAIWEIEKAGNLKTVQEGQRTLRKGYEQRDLVEDYLDRIPIDPNAEYVLNYSKMNGLLKQFRERAEREIAEEYGSGVASGGLRQSKLVSLRDLRAATQELDQLTSSSHANPFAAANKGLLQKLSATLDEDLMRALATDAPDTAAKLTAANRVYAEGISKINSGFGKAIHKYAQDERYDLIAKTVASPRMSVADIPKIMDVAGREGTDAIRASVVADVVSRGKNAQGAMTPQGLSRAMKAYGEDRLRILLTDAQYNKLKDLATLTGSLERGQKILQGSPTAGKARYMAYGSALTGAAVGHPGALAYIIGDVAFNRFVGTRVGQRWLTTGFPAAGTVAGATARQAPRAGVAAYDMATMEED